MTNETDIAVSNARLEARLGTLEGQVRNQREVINEMERRDRNRMRAAISVLGGAVLAMGTFIFQQFVPSK